MAMTPDRRRVARLPIPSQFHSPGLALEAVRLVDLSPEGACIEHDRPLPDWDLCVVILPPALGGLQLQGEVVWSRVAGRKPAAEGRGPAYSQSGLSFSDLTPPQQAGLAAALQRLKAPLRSESRRARCLLTQGPEGDPLWMQLYLQQIAGRWVGMIEPDGSPPRAG